MESARVIIEVVAGLIPGTPMPEYTKRWAVTSAAWEAEGRSALHDRERTADAYATELRNGGLNWVRTDWLWL